MDERERTAADVLAEAVAWGVDLSLLRERLRLTPTERLERHQAMLDFLGEMRAAKVRKDAHDTHRPPAHRID